MQAGDTSNDMKFPCYAVAFSLLLVSLGSAHAQKISAGPFYGYRIGGDFSNGATGQNYKIKDNPSYGVYFDIDPRDSGLKLEMLYSHQQTSVDLEGFVPPRDERLNVHNFQVGGLQELYSGKFRPYVAGYVGATWFDMPDFGDDVRFSFTIALGTNYYLTKNLGLRFDVRGFGTVVEDSGGFICADGGCALTYSGDLLWQGEATASVFLTF